MSLSMWSLSVFFLPECKGLESVLFTDMAPALVQGLTYRWCLINAVFIH